MKAVNNQLAKPLKKQIARAYVIATALLLAFYTIMVHLIILQTENNVGESRLTITAPYHLQQYQHGNKGTIRIDPLLVLYDDYQQLPDNIRTAITHDWTGIQSIHSDHDDSEYVVLAQMINTNDKNSIVYAVEDNNAYEWSDFTFTLFEITLLATGILVGFIAVIFLMRAAKHIASPLTQLVDELDKSSVTNFEAIEIDQQLPEELAQTLAAINSYRSRINQLIKREQTFTRYVSHELRTPMTVITGSLSILRRNNEPNIQKQVARIKASVAEMEQLTATFLLLARDKANNSTLVVDEACISDIVDKFATQINNNQVQFSWQLKQTFPMHVEPQLFFAVIQNLLINAINCSVNGKVSLFVSEQSIEVIDTGVGLNDKPRGYEGFGIGLQLVNDICQKYQWQFSLTNNKDAGCSASVQLNNL